ncbi:hypothetical protein [Halococcus saccharolyticus]|uniref:Small CPxCG-related zinc finger protein n=1 Tax=Halococcus saccharolyticus DSM 5350 TaxID=1227455 RepID=M0ML70_9EURY|nr:hypothetical protein [Halococcus saccharolyticus]EMA46113.1 hypothetical protein C449_05392 [Halococcus saccharolyticus DSM 5350]
MNERRCPDCDVSMTETKLTAGGQYDVFVKTDRDGGLLDRIGIDEHTGTAAHLCPECGLVRLYADIEE